MGKRLFLQGSIYSGKLLPGAETVGIRMGLGGEKHTAVCGCQTMEKTVTSPLGERVMVLGCKEIQLCVLEV